MKIRVMLCLFIGFIVVASQAMSIDMPKISGLQITSPVFEKDSFIPEKYTCDGVDINPPLLITNPPANIKSLALIVDDPDAPSGTWVHWVVWNIDPHSPDIKENSIPKGANQGLNDFRRHNYGGPCPPTGTHRYFFKLYALDTRLLLNSNSTKATVEKAMQGHIISESRIVGLYKRK